jgi:SAM-dependent methyltransferase
MHESHKTNSLRSPEFKKHYLHGRTIDIGAGPDVLTPTSEPFDLEHGDANRILDFREAAAYDCVHSSHCLEHMIDPKVALAQWWGLVKPGGHLILVVPEESLYEQGFWPSLFNPDHKSTFRLNSNNSWSPVSYDIQKLCVELPGAEVINAQVQDKAYDYRLRPVIRPHGVARNGICRFMAKARGRIRRISGLGPAIDPLIICVCRLLSCPVDQTLKDAVAQIQIVVRKALV